MLQKFGAMNRNQKGFTLIELLVVTAVTGLLGAGVAVAVYHVINVNALSSSHIVAVKQVENASYWINRDARMAQTIEPSGESGFPLSLSWVEWDNTICQISYTISNSELRRSTSVNGTQPVQMLVAQYINSNGDNTTCQYSNGVLNFKVTATVGGFRSESETRMAQVIPRSAQ